jgi:hypothetical protein
MSACTISIAFKNDQRSVPLGGSIAGTVTLRAESDCRLRGVSIAAGWKTEGDGNLRKGQLPALAIAEALELHAGDEQRFPFSIPIADGPVSYSGRILRIVWRLKAQADIALGIDARVKEEFTVTRDGATGDMSPGPAFNRERLDRAHQRSQKSRLWLSLLTCFLLSSPFYVYAALSVDWDHPGDEGALIGGGIVLAGLAVFGLLLWRVLRMRRHGDVQVTVNPYLLARGDSLNCTIAFTPRRDVTLADVGMTLLCREHTVYQAGKHTRVRYHPVWAQEQRREVNSVVTAGNPYETRLRLEVPKDQPPSILVQDNSVEWLVKVRLGFDGASDLQREFPVVIG